MFVARRAVFLEKELMSKEASGSQIDLEEIQESTNMESDIGTSSQQHVIGPTVVDPQQRVTKESDIQPPVHRSDRVRHEPKRYNLLISEGDDTHVDLDKPTNYQEAMATLRPLNRKRLWRARCNPYDILLMGNNIPTLRSVEASLGKCFSLKNMVDATYILGIKIYRDKSRRLIGLSQSTYIDKVLSDGSCALSMTSQYHANSGNDHCIAEKNILKYLRRTKEMFLVYRGTEELSIRQRRLSTLQSTEAEFIVDLGVVPSIHDPIEIFCDNEGAIILAKEPISHKRTWHILRNFDYVRKVIEDSYIIISRVGIDGNLVDLFTKPLSQTKHHTHTRSIGIRFASNLA
ncbi:hypothetical protein L6452_09095 [Arctium lappa]|uniref:Uncharacterized protein n=1 Tax=Arctium lappa TaxID=4217 RepID=A0ACB9DJJ7_ARCLA|nr:hypothetical protein L6452_09095 [Arctium lappa]